MKEGVVVPGGNVAVEVLDEVADFIARDSPYYASAMVREARLAAQSLRRFPYRRLHGLALRGPGSEPEQEPDDLFDPPQRGPGDGARAPDEPLPRDRPHLVGQDGGAAFESSLRRPHLDVRRDRPDGRGDGKHRHELGRTAVEAVDREHEHRSRAALLVPAGRVEVCEPDLAATRKRVDHRFFLRGGFVTLGAPSASVESQAFRSARWSFHAAFSSRRRE